MLCKDNSGRALASAESCWVKTQPQLKFGREGGDMIREWVFMVNPLALFVGGNY